MSSERPIKLFSLPAAIIVVLTSSLGYYYYASTSSSCRRRRRRLEWETEDDNDIINNYYGGIPQEILWNANTDDADFVCECHDELILAVRLALEAGQNMMEYYNTKGSLASSSSHNNIDLDISIKSNSCDIATSIDILNEEYISSNIASHFPTHIIIGEESASSNDGSSTMMISSTVPTWIIDPIDGTTNFVAGIPLCCVSIGLCLRGQPYMGIVFAPMTQELYIAVKGRGAYRNGKRLWHSSSSSHSHSHSSISTSPLPPSSSTSIEKEEEERKIMKGKKKSLAESVVCFEFGYERSKGGIDAMIHPVHRLLCHGVRATRSLGSGVLNLCYVASSRLDLVYAGVANEGWKPWDYCAGLVMVMEAGCYITHLRVDDDDEALLVVADENVVNREMGDRDEAGNVKFGYDFNLFTQSMICGVEKELVDEARDVILGSRANIQTS